MASFFEETPSDQLIQGQSLGQPDPYLRQYTPELGNTAVRRGVNQSLGLGADYLGTLADAAGQQDSAQGLYDYADRQLQEAQLQQAGPQTTDDVAGLGSGIDFAINKAGESFPISTTAIGVGLATRGRALPTRIGLAAAPIFPVTAGETSNAMRNDPKSGADAMEHAVASTGAGVVSSALEVLPELGAIGALGHAARPAATMAGALGRGAKTFGESVIGEGLTEGLQDTTSRYAQSLYNSEIGVNPITDEEARKSFIENAAAGAAGGAAFGGPAAVAETLRSAPTPEMPSVDLESLRQGVGNLVSPTGEPAQAPTSERIRPEDIEANQNPRSFINDVLKPQAERAQRYVSDIPGNIEETLRQQMDREDSLTNRAVAVRDRLMKRGDLTAEEQATVNQELDLDPEAQDAVHEIDRQKTLTDTIRSSLQRFAGVDPGRASRINPNVPLEEVDSIVQQAGIQQEAENPLVRQWLAAYGEKLGSGTVDQADINAALDIFGERGYSVLRALAGGNRTARAAIDADQQANGQLDQFLFQALKPEYRESIRPGQLRQLGNLVRGATDRGEGDIGTILETAFQNPGEVMAALDSGVGRLDVGRSQAQTATQDEEGQDVEFGDTQSVTGVSNRYFGDLSGGRRIRAGNEVLPIPVTREQAMDIGRKAEGFIKDSDITLVPARTVYDELAIDPADAATQMGRENVDGLFYIRGQEPKAETDLSGPFTRKLSKTTIEALNTAGKDPSAGSYIAATDENGAPAAIDVRKMIGAQVFGDRTPAKLLEALNNGLADAISKGYTIKAVPDGLVMARYGKGADEQAVTVGEAQARAQKRSESAEGSMPIEPNDFEALTEAGYKPQVDFRTGELHLPQKDVREIIDRYAAAVAGRNAQERGTTVPKWTQALIDKHGTEFPPSLGRMASPGTFMARARAWAIDEGLDSKALEAMVPRSLRTDRADAAAARVRAEEERQGPETGVMESDAETAPAQVIEAETGREGSATRVPERPYAVRGGDQHQDFFTTARKAEQVHREQFWATGDLPTGVDLQGVYGVLGKIAGKGQPLQVVVAKQRGVEMPADVAKLIEAYQRRGFNIRTDTKMLAPMQDSPYSETVSARVMGPTGDSPAHVVLSLGETRAAALARRLGIPVIDLTHPTQQKIAGDILRSYDRGRRAEVARSTMPKESKDKLREGESRTGTDRSRDMLNAALESAITTNVARPDIVDQLLRVSSLAARADADFFDVAMASKDPLSLARQIDALEGYFAEYQAEGKQSLKVPGKTQTATEEQFDNARDYIAKVLPPDVRTVVKRMATMSGIYTETELKDGDIDKIISLSAYAQDPMSVAHHESMHALISALAGQKEQAPFIKSLLKAANSPLVISRLRALLKNEPQALEQMVRDPEERIAYMYEFWAAGQLQLTDSVENWVVKLVQTLRGIFGVLSNNEKAGLYMAAFRDGKLRDPSAVNSVVMDSLSTPERVVRALPFAHKVEKITRKVVETAHGRLKSYGNPALDRIANGFYADSMEGGQRSGYLQTVRDITNLYGSQFADIIRGTNDADLNELATALHTNKRPTDEALQPKYDQIKRLMRRLYNYMEDSGIQLPKVNDYFPQAWDKQAIRDDREGFEQMLVENAQYRTKDGELHDFTPETARGAADTLLGESGRLDLREDLAGFSPWMEATNQRTIVLANRAAAVDYFDHDLVRVVSRYITQASKRGEYTRHFGQDGERIESWLRDAMRYGNLTEEDLVNDVVPAIRAMEGTLGHDISPLAKDFMSGIMAWQNLAVLPLAIFSSLIDPMGIAVRGGSVEQAWNAFKAGLKNIPQSLKKNGSKLDIQDLAESIGTVESQNVLDMLGDMYGSAYMSDWARKTNNLMFRYNMMEGWNTAMRSSATIAALDFIKRHANGENEHSARYIDELGLTKDDLHFDDQGNLLWKQVDIARSLLAQGGDVSRAQEISRKTREGITRWVDGAVLRPHAAHRPAWASDPHYMLIWHLKQFTYSFQKTILERVIHEARNGNYNPSLVLASYVPFMIAADYMRGLVQGLGDEPDWKKGKTFGETVWEGTQRAGLLGIRQFAVDGAENPAFALGPTFSYAYGAAEKAADGRIGDAITSALPGNAMWKGW